MRRIRLIPSMQTSRPTAWRACIGAALAMALSACGDPRIGGLSPRDVTPSVAMTNGQFVGCRPDLISAPSINWVDPPPDGLVVSSSQAAATQLAFIPREPQGLGTPDFIWVSGGPESSRGSKGIRFKYTTPSYGVIIVAMWLDPIAESERIKSWEQQVQQENSGDPCFSGYGELVSIKGGKTALIGGPPNEARVTANWREGLVWVQVAGPALGREDALSIAEAL